MNIAQIAYMAGMKEKVTRILFAGNFLRGNDLAMAMISFSIHYWSHKIMKAYYLKHEGYCGSLGVFLAPDHILKGDENL